MEHMRPSKLIPDDLAKELWGKSFNYEGNALDMGEERTTILWLSGYFNDMAQALKEMVRVLKPDHYAIMILGDSAPYGVYIPTHEYLGKIALNVGFSEYRTVKLRKRGHKRKYIQETGRRHKVELGKYMLILKK